MLSFKTEWAGLLCSRWLCSKAKWTWILCSRSWSESKSNWICICVRLARWPRWGTAHCNSSVLIGCWCHSQDGGGKNSKCSFHCGCEWLVHTWWGLEGQFLQSQLQTAAHGDSKLESQNLWRSTWDKSSWHLFLCLQARFEMTTNNLCNGVPSQLAQTDPAANESIIVSLVVLGSLVGFSCWFVWQGDSLRWWTIKQQWNPDTSQCVPSNDDGAMPTWLKTEFNDDGTTQLETVFNASWCEPLPNNGRTQLETKFVRCTVLNVLNHLAHSFVLTSNLL